MDGKAPAKPREQKVTNQRAGWEMSIILLLCLLQAANALKGPRLVSGKPGGTVTIQCHYTLSPSNRHQRKYWCRLNPLTGLCHTVVSTNHYTHFCYGGRVALRDFPQGGLFVVSLSQLSPDDVGSYRCGIGNSNHMRFFGMKLIISAGPLSPIPRTTPAASELVRGSFGAASTAANRWTPGNTQAIGRRGRRCNRVALTPGTSKRTTSAKEMQTLRTPEVVATGTVSQVEFSIYATIPIPGSSAATIRIMADATEGPWLRGTRSSGATRARASEEGSETMTEADIPREEAERVRITLNADWTAIGTIRSSTLASEKWAWETLQEARLVSKPQALDSIEGTTPAAGWTWGPTNTEMSSTEGSTEGELDLPAGDNGHQITPSQDLGEGPQIPPGKGSSMKSACREEKNISRILTPVSTVLFPLMLGALVLLQRKLRRKSAYQETEEAAGVTLIQITHFLELSLQPDELPHVERKVFQIDSPPAHAT
ncbi:high affinity immunoglobulin alpha and immunoglobulin mu Fc receptor [Pteronotus mesoamericanus]|uniref:high affinity immunoglobulin alpha and immunoglobulin mu Fc receptor n=1 Tax=Pteronotus mesoamericanus TaxID=1884717 RepID=UPI0023EC3600|nr:high affinity immunoglobulin alpha and immunoglobulin mu Fc receptor [Pteronotus parnellii mesoamericanus]